MTTVKVGTERPSTKDKGSEGAALRIAEGTARAADHGQSTEPHSERGVTGAVPLGGESRTRTLELSVYEIDNNPFQPRASSTRRDRFASREH